MTNEEYGELAVLGDLAGLAPGMMMPWKADVPGWVEAAKRLAERGFVKQAGAYFMITAAGLGFERKCR